MIPYFLLPLPSPYLPDPPQVLISDQSLLFAVAMLPDPRVFARRDRRLRLPVAYSLIATPFVIRAVAAYLLYVILYLLKQITQHLAVGKVVGRHHGSYYLACRFISTDVELSPSPALGVAVLTDFPFTFAEDFYARRVNDHMQRLIAFAARQHHIKCPATAAQSSVIRRGQIHAEQLDYRLHQSFGSTQRQMKDLSQSSHAEDGRIGVVTRLAALFAFIMITPLSKDVIADPDSETSALNQCGVILFPIAEAVSALGFLLLHKLRIPTLPPLYLRNKAVNYCKVPVGIRE